MTHSAFVADEVCELINNSGKEPFFCIAGFYAPHAPVNPPNRFVDMYDASQMPLPTRNSDENFENTSDEQWREIKAFYYALVSHIDDQIGKILKKLEESGKKNDTIVVFTSDHGEYLGDHGRVQKGGPEDSSSKIPLIISYPEKIKPGEYSQIVEGVDIVPTILDYCGIQTPDFMQGRSLRPLLEDKEYKERTSAFMEIKLPFESSYKAIRTQAFMMCLPFAPPPSTRQQRAADRDNAVPATGSQLEALV
jgi:arylsulfatase A-like enzyme